MTGATVRRAAGHARLVWSWSDRDEHRTVIMMLGAAVAFGLLRGDLATAWTYNPSVFLVGPFAVVLVARFAAGVLT